MPDFPFDTVGLKPEEIDRLQQTYTALKDKFGIQLTGNINFHLKQFEVFKHCFDVNVRDSYVIKEDGNSSYVLFVETHLKTSNIKAGVTDHCDCQTWALAYLKHNFGRVVIRPETLRDKIVELIHPLEIDFKEDKAFSDVFYVIANDHDKAVKGINRNFRNAVMDIREDDFVIEIVEHTLIIGSKKTITPDRAVHLAEFVARVAETC
ncbi:hypothetical protein GCM10027049_09710 [Mucilaginibacter puniceus]